MFGFKSNNSNFGNNGVNVNTPLFSSYSDTCKITMGAWNMQLSLKFHPFKGVNADGVRQYASDNSEIVNTSLTLDNVTALLEGVKEKLMPAIEKNEATSVSVIISTGANRKMLELSTDGEEVYATIYVNVQDDGTVQNPELNSLKHKFNKRGYIVGYNCTTGDGEEVPVNTEFIDFIEKLNGVYGLAPITAHSINYNNAIKNARGNQIAAANNIAPQYQAPQTNFNDSDMSGFLPFS